MSIEKAQLNISVPPKKVEKIINHLIYLDSICILEDQGSLELEELIKDLELLMGRG